MALGNERIELRGGPAHGRRMVVPKGTGEAAIPVTRNADGRYVAAIYRPTGQYTDDGVALWSLKGDDSSR